MLVFEQKLKTLPHTIRMAAEGPLAGVAAALRAGRGMPTIAIGSGGSAVTAEFFGRCRSTLGLGVTMVMTPMDFVVSTEEWKGWDIWLFSAGADNPDIAAAFTAAVGSGASFIRLMTVNADGATVLKAEHHENAETFVVPVYERKDGFLATHSLVAMVTGLLLASDRLSEKPQGPSLFTQFSEDCEAELLSGHAGQLVADFQAGDTIIMAHDPQCRTMATLIDTSLWETGIAPVQTTDFRNFAHGRHVWAARHPESLFMLSVTAIASRDIWAPIGAALPAGIRRGQADLGHAGRFGTALSVIKGLVIINALGALTRTDPGKPGRGEFAGAIYDNRALTELADMITPSATHKVRSVNLHDSPSSGECPVHQAGRDWALTLTATAIGGIVMDYDGTIVTTRERLKPPADEIVSEIERLVDAGLQVGFATGRGGSAGEMLRSVLPARIHDEVTMGYYNGGHIRPLGVDIKIDQPQPHTGIVAVGDWIASSGILRSEAGMKRGAIQLTVNHLDLGDSDTFLSELRGHPDVVNGSVEIVSSHHSFDIFPKGTSKRAVVSAVQSRIQDPIAQILRIGDSGSASGNDYSLLSEQPSVSVDKVCGEVDGCWTLFGDSHKGPAALLRVLRALRVENGVARLHFSALN